MKFLVIGLGSMGKRRIRNLQSLGGHGIAGFDVRQDRRKESLEKYHIEIYSDFEEALTTFQPDVLVISTSPEHHMFYAYTGFELGLSCFIEASVVDAEGILELEKRCVDAIAPILMAPSCTMRYFPGPKIIKELIGQKVIGEVLNLNYQVGQYLPDWHPWEKVEDYYVGNRETGGAREIVPFELTWLNDIFGMPTPLASVKTKLTRINADIDDIYHCLLKYPGEVLANITVEVISRPKATRELRILGADGEIVFSVDENCVRYSTINNPEWTRYELGDGTVENGYINPEEPYIAEMRDFISAVSEKNNLIFPNTLRADYDVLQTLYRLEALSEKI